MLLSATQFDAQQATHTQQKAHHRASDFYYYYYLSSSHSLFFHSFYLSSVCLSVYLSVGRLVEVTVFELTRHKARILIELSEPKRREERVACVLACRFHFRPKLQKSTNTKQQQQQQIIQQNSLKLNMRINITN